MSNAGSDKNDLVCADLYHRQIPLLIHNGLDVQTSVSLGDTFDCALEYGNGRDPVRRRKETVQLLVLLSYADVESDLST
jgi:hypothetical protein